MKKLLSILASAMLLSTVFLSSGCGDEETTTPDVVPSIELTDGTDPITEVTITELSGKVTVHIEGTVGTKDLKSLTIEDPNGVIDDARVNNKTTGGGDGVMATVGADAKGFHWEIELTAHDSYETQEYHFILEDAAGLKADAHLEITILEPIEMEINGVLWNQAGPAGRGALDLDSGNTTGISSADPVTGTLPEEAEIRDCGIDSSNVAQPSTWRKQITWTNGTEMVYVGVDGSVDVDFDAIDTKEGIQDAYDAGDALSNDPVRVSGSNTWGSHKVSKVVEVGDVFAVKKTEGSSTTFYLIRIDVVDDIPGELENDDSYLISIKY